MIRLRDVLGWSSQDSQLVELVTECLEGALPEDRRARFDEHLRGRDGCTAYMEQFETTIRLTGILTDEQVSPEAREALLGAFRAWNA